MNNINNKPEPYLWVLRALTSGFLLGYLVSIYLIVVASGWFPGMNTWENLLAIGLLILFGAAYSLMWINREGWAAAGFIIWYAALWGMKFWIGGVLWEDAPVPGTILFLLAILFLVKKAISIK